MWVIYNFIVILMQVQQARSVHRLLALTMYMSIKNTTHYLAFQLYPEHVFGEIQNDSRSAHFIALVSVA